MAKCTKCVTFEYNPMDWIEIPGHSCEVRLGFFDDGYITMSFGEYGQQFSTHMSKEEMRKFFTLVAPYIGFSITDVDELWEEEKHDS